MFLSYGEYQSWGGTITDELMYDRLNYRADTAINKVTHGRVKDEDPVRECVKRLAFELIELFQSNMAGGSVAANVNSFSNDGVSVSYASGEQANATLNSHIQALALSYLADETDADGVCLLYAGVMG